MAGLQSHRINRAQAESAADRCGVRQLFDNLETAQGQNFNALFETFDPVILAWLIKNLTHQKMEAVLHAFRIEAGRAINQHVIHFAQEAGWPECPVGAL